MYICRMRIDEVFFCEPLGKIETNKNSLRNYSNRD